MDEKDVIVRCCQGHSGHVFKQMSNESAHTVVKEGDVTVLDHATKTDRLKHIIGLGAPGLIPGGEETARK